MSLKKEDLVIGEIYKDKDNGNLVKYKYISNNFIVNGPHIGISFGSIKDTQDTYSYSGGNFNYERLTTTTDKEKHWLNECIRLDEYVTLSKAMETFKKESLVGRYLKMLIYSPLGTGYPKGTYVKITEVRSDESIRCAKNMTFGKVENFKKNSIELMPEGFNPELTSLPKQWHIKQNISKDVCEWFSNKRCTSTASITGTYEYLCCNNKNYSFTYGPESIEITFEQFKKWVLKEDKPKFEVGKWYKNLGSEGQYIAKFDSLEDGKFFTKDYINIGSGSYFEMFVVDNLTNNLILAVECPLEEIQQYLPYGHVDKISEPKESLLKEAKRRYPIGTRFKIVHMPEKVSYVKHDNYFSGENNNIYCASEKNISDYEEHQYNGNLYQNGQWAEIVSTPEKELVKTGRISTPIPKEDLIGHTHHSAILDTPSFTPPKPGQYIVTKDLFKELSRSGNFMYNQYLKEPYNIVDDDKILDPIEPILISSKKETKRKTLVL